jgi:hypothetical protein
MGPSDTWRPGGGRVRGKNSKRRRRKGGVTIKQEESPLFFFFFFSFLQPHYAPVYGLV